MTKEHDQAWDLRLRIETGGRDDTVSDQYRYPYEPTPYAVLARLADSGFIRERDVVLDYGCGKGRVGFFLSHKTGASAIGIEYDQRMLACAENNRKRSGLTAKTAFLLSKAEEFEVPADVSCCYFFNPFSVEILRKVMARLLESYYASPREVTLFFYYPSADYIAYLMTVDELEYMDEIECGDLFEGTDARECIMIFRLPESARFAAE